MGGLLASPSSGPTTAAPAAAPAVPQMSSHDKAVMDLKVTRDKLHKYKKKAERERETLIIKAKEQLKLGRKDKAAVVLKAKRYKEQMLSKLEGQLDNVAQLITSIETAQLTTQIMNTLDAGNKVLKQLNEEMPIEKIEEIMQDSAEAVAYQEEVAALLSQSLTSEDTVAVDEEMAEMEKELLGEPVHLPAAPKTKVEIEVKEQEQEPEPVRQREMVAN